MSQPAGTEAAAPSFVRSGWTDSLAGWAAADAGALTRLVLRAVVASRVIVWAAGLLAIALLGTNAGRIAGSDPQHLTEPFRSALANLLVAPAARWDSAWYLTIAQHGYVSLASSAFFPLYPLLMRAGAALFGSALLAGGAISITAMAVALVVAYRLVRLDLGDLQARLTVLLLAFFPTAFFLSAVYTESLFLALSLGAIYAARTERWAWAGVLGGLASATRSNGVLILLPLALLFLYGPRQLVPRPAALHLGAPRWRPRYRLSRPALWLGLVPIGLIAYVVYAGLALHDPLAPFQAQSFWSRRFAGPLGGIAAALLVLPACLEGIAHGVLAQPHDLIDLGYLAFGVAGVLFCRGRVPFAYIAYGVASLAEAVSYPAYGNEPLLSMGRFVLVIFPVFIGWGARLSEHPRLSRGTVCGCAVLLVVFSGLWATWAWVA